LESVLKAWGVLVSFPGELLLSLKKMSELTGINKSRINRL